MNLTERILQDYSSYLKIERAMSPNTVASYSSDLRKFFSSVDIPPSEVSTKDIRLSGRPVEALAGEDAEFTVLVF